MEPSPQRPSSCSGRFLLPDWSTYRRGVGLVSRRMNWGVGWGVNLFVRPQTSLLWTAAKSNTCDDRVSMMLKKVDNSIRVLIENGV